MNRKQKLFLTLVICWLGFIFAHSMMPASASDKESSGLLAFLQQFIPTLSHHFLRKLAHFSIFAVLGGLLYGLYRQFDRFCLLKPLGAALCAAFADETIQLFVEGRSGQISDIWIDFFGAACAIFVVHFISKIKYRTSS